MTKPKTSYAEIYGDRPIVIHICKDGTISYRRRGEKVFNGVALPVFTVDTVEQAEAIQIRFGRRAYSEHPDIPGKPWYRLSRLRDGTDPALRGDGTLKIGDLTGITEMFHEFWKAGC